MWGLVCNKASFLQVEVVACVSIFIADPKSKKYGQVQGKEKRVVGRNCIIRLVEVVNRIFSKIKKFRVGLRLPEAFGEQLDHEKGNGIFMDVRLNVQVEVIPFEFTKPLEVPQFVMVDYQVKDICWLEMTGLWT